MIKITLKQLQASSQAISKLSEIKLKGKAAYSVGKMVRVVQSEFELFQKEWQKLLESYGTLDEENKGQYKIESDKLDEFNIAANGLLATEVELNCNPLKLIDIENVDGFNGQIIAPLDWFILEE